MVFRRRNRRNKNARGRKRGPGRVIQQKGKLTDSTIYRFKRMTYYTSIASSASLPVYGAFNFKLSDIPTASEFTNLFDAYRIRGVKLTFMPKVTSNDQNSNNYGTFTFVPDYDDAVSPTSNLDLMQHQSCRVKQPSCRPFTCYMRPRPAIALYQPSAFTAYSQAPLKTWVDCNNVNVEYYGFKYAWVGTSLATVMDVFATWYLEFKTPR